VDVNWLRKVILYRGAQAGCAAEGLPGYLYPACHPSLLCNNRCLIKTKSGVPGLPSQA
jgi:hypothetical protein